MRFGLIKFLLAILFVLSLASCNRESESHSVNVVSWGGKYQKLLMDTWIIPASKKAKIDVSEESYGGEYASISRMVETGTTTWDLVQVETFYAAYAKENGLLEKFSPPINTDNIVELDDRFKKLLPYAYPTIGWSYVMAWNESVIKGIPNSKHPSDWSDFWDFEAFPGKRALRNTPQGNLEIALLAAGYSHEDIVKKLYEENNPKVIDEAFSMLDKIKDKVIWWSTGDQLQLELESGRAALIAAWHGRVWMANKFPRSNSDTSLEGGCCRLTFKDAVLDYDWWIIPKGSANIQNASLLVREMYQEVSKSVEFSQSTGYGSPINGWEETEVAMKDAEFIKNASTANKNLSMQFKVDPFFWAQNHRILNTRWAQWKAE